MQRHNEMEKSSHEKFCSLAKRILAVTKAEASGKKREDRKRNHKGRAGKLGPIDRLHKDERDRL
jgi:hypothetical protein